MCTVDGATVLAGGDTVVLSYESQKPYAACNELPSFDARFFRKPTGGRWSNPEPLIGPKRPASAAEADWLAETGHELEPALKFDGSRLTKRRGHNAPVYNVGVAHEPDESNPDDEVMDAVDLPDSSFTYAETLVGILPRTKRKPNELPEDLPVWVTPGARVFLENARLTSEQIRRLLTSRDLAARRVCEHAEALASSWTRDDTRKGREIHTDRAHAVLRNMLALADEIRGIKRREDARIQARFETVRQQSKSKRRSEMLDIYRELLQPVQDAEHQRQRDIAQIYEDECRGRTQHVTHNGVRHGWFLINPERAAEVKPVEHTEQISTKNKAIPRGCNETPSSVCALMDMRAPRTTERPI